MDYPRFETKWFGVLIKEKSFIILRLSKKQAQNSAVSNSLFRSFPRRTADKFILDEICVARSIDAAAGIIPNDINVISATIRVIVRRVAHPNQSVFVKDWKRKSFLAIGQSASRKSGVPFFV
jgi:hypothetical protein